MHCFTETWEIARRALDLGFYISFSGIVTFKNALAIREVARKAPLDRILAETDAPYLAPVPYRGKRNEPAYVRHVAEEIARLRDLSLGNGRCGDHRQLLHALQTRPETLATMKRRSSHCCWPLLCLSLHSRPPTTT